MWKFILMLLLGCLFCLNYVQATYNSGIKTRVYDHQPISQDYQHQNQQSHTPTYGHYNQYSDSNNDKDYQASIANHYVHTDNSYQHQQHHQQQQQQQQQHEGDYYQQTPIISKQPQPLRPPIYERKENSQTQTGNWQNSENSVTEYYTGCPTGHTGQLPYAYDCRRFLNCWHGRGHIQTCSVGTVFNPESLECDRPDKVKCEAALEVLGVQSMEKLSSPSHGTIKHPHYRAGRYTDITDDNVEVLCPIDAQGLQPHPSDCTRFVNCANGNMYIQQCGPGTAYSIPMKICDYKDKVDCSGREGEDANRAPKQTEFEISCPADASGLYPHPEDCTKFLQCSNGETYIQDCGPGTAFDSVRLICDYKNKVKCCSSCVWSNENINTQSAASISPSTSESGAISNTKHADLPHTADILCLNGLTALFPYPFDYTKFINCKNGNTAIQNCFPNTAFSISKGYCESLEENEKTDHVMYIVSQVSYEYSQTLITCPPGTDGLHLYPFNAELYVKCVKSQMQILPCNNGHVFSIIRRTCLPNAQVLRHERVRLLSELQSSSNYRITDENYTLKTKVYCPGLLSGTYPHPFDSTKYLKCVGGRLMSESCASGQAFSLSRKTCGLKEEMNTDDYVAQVKLTMYGQGWGVSNVEITHGSVDGLTYLMCPPGLTGYFLHPLDCTKYIECSEHGTTVDNCLNGTVFSISRKECIPRDKVKAYDRVEYMMTTKNEFTSDNKEQHNPELGVSCTSGTFGIYPHPYDYHKYIRCANGRLSVENCADGQVFSITRSFCHNENEVGNNDRSSYSRGFSTTQDHFKIPVTATTNTVPSFRPTPSEVINPPAIGLRPPLPTALTIGVNDNISCPPGATGRYPHPFDCTKFLMCANGMTNVKDCGPGTAWNKKMEVCDFKEKVDCSASISSVSDASQYQCPAGVNGLYQHPYDWHKYLVCSHGTTTVMNCAPGTVFSLSRKICDFENNVVNSDRCNNGVYVSGYDYAQEQNYNNHDQHSTADTSNIQWSAANPKQIPTTTQTIGNRWVNMDVTRPQTSTYNQTTTWQQSVNNYGRKPIDLTPVYTGSGINIDEHNPTHTIISEEGSFEPNRNYNRPMYSTPLAPLKPTTTTTTASIVYPQPVGSQEDSKEIFSNTAKQPSNEFSPQYFPTSSRQNHTRQTSQWTPIRPVDLPRHDQIHPYQSTVYTNTREQIPSTSYPSTFFPSSQPSWSESKTQDQTSVTQLTSPYDTEDSGQKPLLESELKITNVNIDYLPGQKTYNLNDFDQLSSDSIKHNINDLSHLYDSLQPPVDKTLTSTTTKNAFYPYEQSTQVASPTKPTSSTHRIRVYPPLSNASIQTFPHQPHYSPPYAEVAHSRNASWVGRKLPQHSAIKTNYRNPFSYEHKITSTPLPEFNPSPYSNKENDGDELTTDDQEATMKQALTLLLKPYLDSNSEDNDNNAEKVQSHIMNLVLTTDKDSIATTTTHKPFLNKNTLIPSTKPHQEDVELIIAGEQHHLVGVTTTQTDNHDSSTLFNVYHTPLQPERTTYNHDHNTNWPKNHNHGPHNLKLKHSRDFHKKHPNLPNPFDDPNNSHNPHAKDEVQRAYDFDVRIGGRCSFECGNGKCVEQHQVCDGVNNCGNRKDEQDCDHLGYELRLTGGQNPNMGRVEVKILGKWGYVCDDKFGLRDADVVCRELGFKMGAMEVRGSSYYSPSDVNVYFAMDEVECKGNETSLRECDFKGWGVNNCGPDEVVGVVCKVSKLKCPDNYWLCTNTKECIPTAFLCDVTPDCEDASDESEEVCNAPIKYRLEGGRGSTEGRLEVFYRGEWGTVCDDDFGLKEAQVVCNSFRLYGKPEIFKNIYGPGSGPIWLDQVSCWGNESKIDECNHWSWGENNCNHTEDVGIKCTAGPKPIASKANKPQTDDASNQDQNLESSLQFEQSELDDLGLYQELWQRSSKAVNKQKKCGHFKSNLIDEYEYPEERVINGTIAKRGRHPWQATIRTRGRGGISSHWCGAVIISRKLILTAAHCLAGYPKGSYFVRMGDHYANIAESSEIDSNIENWYIHEKFRDQKHMNNDIALILLKTPVLFNDYVQPVCLPEKGTTLETNRKCTISGWGSIKSGTSTPSNILRSAQVPILADEVCSQKNVYANAMTEGMFCAGFLDESADACDGDSGGPLVCSDKDGETLYGIISWGQHCGYANHPGVYVRVEKYIDWIYEKINLILQQGKL